MIEITGRAGATCLPETVGLYYGINYYEAIVRLAMDMEPEKLFAGHKPQQSSLSRILTSDRSGIVKEIHNTNSIWSRRNYLPAINRSSPAFPGY